MPKDKDTTEIIIRHVPNALKRAVKSKSADDGVTMNNFIVGLIQKALPDWNKKKVS
jgi:hypothetical protein